MSAEGEAAPHAGENGVLTIDLAAIATNWRALSERAKPAQCAAVVKADAYGCGIEPVARALAAAGCNTFFVAHLAEGRRTRSVAPHAAIYVLNGLLPGSAPAYAADALRPTLGSSAELGEWRAFCSATGWRGLAALHVDTGINRLGLTPTEAEALNDRSGIALLMSHFACADDPAHPLNAVQIGRFRELTQSFAGIPASLANSSGIFLGPDAQFDMVRPGVALYGANPTLGHVNPMQPVVRLEARIIQIRNVRAGETVGYGATWSAKRDSRIAILSLGYADGFPRSAGSTDLAPGADAIVAGHRCPLAGRISMDLIAIDVTAVPSGHPRRGEPVTLIGGEIDLDEIAAHSGTIAYEVLTRLGQRYRRIYRGP